ncbi:MAG: 30S ribosomal protein S16, partial [Candidatus Saccharimonas sp.]
SGRVVAYVGTYNPHTKDTKVQVEVAQRYLDNGAQPSPRVVKLLEAAGVKMPNWVKKFDGSKVKQTRKSDKLRKNQPKAEVAPAPEAVEVTPVVETDEVEPTPEAAEAPSEK